MDGSRKSLIASVGIVLIAVAAFGAWYLFWSPWATFDSNKKVVEVIPHPAVIAVSDFDVFQKQLADRVSTMFRVDASTVVVAPAAYDLGWLLDSVQTYPADQTDCVPKPLPIAIEAPHLFPSYQLSSNLAATMTLGSDALQQLTNASLNVSHNANLVYSIDNVRVLLMDTKTIERITQLGACKDYLSQHPKSRLIHGLVLGRISFKFSTDNPASVEAKLPKIGGISAKGDSNNSTVTVTDDQPSQILEMVSILDPQPAGRAPASVVPEIVYRQAIPIPPHTTSPHPPFSRGAAHIFFQQDIADQPNAGKKIAAQLRLSWPDAVVETKVERIPTSKMPSSPQIRFFNAGDQALANICHDRLKTLTGIDARVVRIGLVAPLGQLEVWLQKVVSTQ